MRYLTLTGDGCHSEPTFSDNNIKEADRVELSRTWGGIMAKSVMPGNATVEFYRDNAAKAPHWLLPPPSRAVRIQWRDDDGTHHGHERHTRSYKRSLLELVWLVKSQIKRESCPE